MTTMNDKIKSIDDVKPILATIKNNGKKIIFTNGCFDLLHIGHIRYLNECKKAGDILVIGINTDESIKQNKGDLRPITPLAERCELLAALEMVDFVVPFNEKTPADIIKTLKPDVLIKGADYSLDNIVGKDDVLSWGGSVFTIPLIKGKSTKNIIRKIVDLYNE
ncbi:D-glycero-beta-D-manno-heptose 1-phosphate adenylyltransferase [bacterium]|nr:D-glycero-beta-D-manno-heptose 1-phosphate adenylyltransferase [bacterium]